MSTVLKNLNGTKRTSGPASVQSFSRADRASTQVTRQIDSLVIQLRRQLWWKGSCLLVAVAAATLLALTVADAFLQPQSFAARASRWFIGSLLCLEAIRRFLFTPLRRDCDRLQLAWSLEQHHPEIEERLTSTLQLATNEDQRGSVFVEAIAGQAQAGIANCSDDALAGRSLRRAFLVAAFGIFLLVIALFVSPNRLLPSLANVLRPWHERVLPSLDAVILPGNTAVAEGSSVNIQVRGRQLDNAIVEFFTIEPQPVAHNMVSVVNGTEAQFLLANVKSPLTYRIRSNGLYSEKFQINVHPAPVIEQLQASAQFPEYTQINTVQIDHLEGQNPVGRITVVHGTLITLLAKTPTKTADSELSLDTKVSPGNTQETPSGEGGSVVEWTFPIAGVESPDNPDIRRGSVTLVSEHGVRSQPINFEILVTKDLPPLVEISLPGPGHLTVKPDQQLTLPYRAADDYGIQSLEVVTKVGTQEPTVSDIANLEFGKQMDGETTLDLRPHNLKPGDVLTVWLRATDNRGAGMDPSSVSGGPQSTESIPIILQAANDALPPGQQSIQSERDLVQNGINEAIKNLKTALEETEEYSKSLTPQEANQAEQEQARKSSNEIREQIKSAQKALEQIDDYTKTKVGPLFQPEAQQCSEVSKRELKEADQQARLFPLSDKKDDRRRAAEETRQQLENALQKLNDVRESINRRSRDMELAAQLDDLAKRQDQLAKDLKEPRKDTEKDAQKQKEVADQLQKLANDDEQTRSELFRQRSEKAEQLAKEAEQLKQQQEQLAQLNKEQAEEKAVPDIDQKLATMIAKEQDAIRDQAQAESLNAKQPERDMPACKGKPSPAEVDGNQPLNAARQHMDEAAKQLRQKSIDQAKEQADKALDELSKANADTASKDSNGQEPPNETAPKAKDANGNTDKPESTKAQPQPQASQDANRSLARQQQRVRDAIQAVKENRPEEAAAKLQEQITERTEQLRKKADDLLQLPSDDAQNQQAMKEAQEKLKQASDDANAAKEAMNDQKQAAAQKKGQENKPAQQQPAQQQPAQQQPAQQQQAQPNQKAAEKQAKAAKAIEEAMQSLQGVCKSCQNCANCNKPGGSSGTSGKPGNSNASSPRETQPKAGQTNAEPKAEKKSDSDANGNKQLAQAADKASQSAKKPSLETADELARDLNKLADEAATKSQFPGRKGDGNKPEEKTGEKSGEKPGSQKSNSQPSPNGKPGGKSGQPQGATGQGQSSDELTNAEHLRGPSSSNWTRSRRMLNGNVLDANEARIPQEYRGIVENYFEQLSRMESQKDEPQDSTPKENTPKNQTGDKP